jgi:hypothetical protein
MNKTTRTLLDNIRPGEAAGIRAELEHGARRNENAA